MFSECLNVEDSKIRLKPGLYYGTYNTSKRNWKGFVAEGVGIYST